MIKNRASQKEFILKMIEAKRLEKEAIMMIVPDHMRGHLSVIQKEIKAMLIDCLTTPENSNSEPKSNEPTVKKVDIG